MINFCINCGAKIRKEDNFCTQCGTKIDRSDIKQNKNLSKPVINNTEKQKAEKLKMIDEIFESIDNKSKTINNKTRLHLISIKGILKNKVINENISEEEIHNILKTELEKMIKEQKKVRTTKEKEIASKKIENNETSNGGYCDLSCMHCFEEFLDSCGGIVGDFDSEGYVEYYCNLGHSISYGSFCKDYE